MPVSVRKAVRNLHLSFCKQSSRTTAVHNIEREFVCGCVLEVGCADLVFCPVFVLSLTQKEVFRSSTPAVIPTARQLTRPAA